MNFHDIRMPEFIESFAIGKPEFATSCVTTKSGREARHLDRENVCQKYLIKNAKLSAAEFEQFNSFFKARRGSNFAFRFRDYADYKVTEGIIAKGGGNLNKFQLKKIYADPILPYERVITKPVNNSVTLYINNVRTMGIIDYNDGAITLPNPLNQDEILTADFVFDVAVRFSVDSFEYSYCGDGSIELSDIELMEVIV
ncbi:MAG TPA: TIGR02217 family protein [Rickettsia endosymbiont of Bembidion nr. Transversale]|nr:TIGR02217 family protein [Rickettsia endosymbiont of Bembidion nr. Transversale]